jgi:MFS family permease
MRGAGGLAGVRAALGQRNYAVYVAGNAVSLIGTWMQRIAVGWLAWELTGSAFWVGAVAFADLFPTVFTGPVAGAVSDRYDRLRVAMTTQVLASLQAVTLAVLVWTGAITVELLFALTFLLGILVGFNQPARLALIPSLVGRENLPAAIAINSIVFNTARFVGPAAAGAAILAGGTALAFAVNAASFLVFVFTLTRIRLAPEPARPTPTQGLFRDTADGLAYALRHPGIGPILGLMLAGTLLGRPLTELLPGFAAAVFRGGPETLAALSSAVGVGAVLAGLRLAARGEPAGLVGLVMRGHAAAAAATLAVCLVDRTELAVAAMAVFGYFAVTTGVGTQTLVQLAVEPRMRGRVVSLYGMVLRGGPAVGALAMGTAAEFAGFRVPVAAGALATAAVALAMLARRRAIAAALEGPPSEAPTRAAAD